MFDFPTHGFLLLFINFHICHILYQLNVNKSDHYRYVLMVLMYPRLAISLSACLC